MQRARRERRTKAIAVSGIFRGVFRYIGVGGFVQLRVYRSSGRVHCGICILRRGEIFHGGRAVSLTNPAGSINLWDVVYIGGLVVFGGYLPAWITSEFRELEIRQLVFSEHEYTGAYLVSSPALGLRSTKYVDFSGNSWVKRCAIARPTTPVCSP